MSIARVILPVTSATQTNPLTWAKAKRWVARGVTSINDPEKLSEAGEYIWAAIQEWNTRHQFAWMEKTNSNISLVAGTMTYDLPSDFNHVYSVYTRGANDQPLTYAPRRLRNRVQYAGDSEVSGTPEIYDIFSHGQTGKITIFPAPPTGTTDVLVIDYYRLITEPVNDQATFDLPKKYVWYVLYKAKAMMLADHRAEDARLGYWESKGEQGFRKARADDMDIPDGDSRFLSKQEYGTRYPFTDVQQTREEAW